MSKLRYLKCIVGTEPGEVRKFEMPACILDGKLVRVGTYGDFELALVCVEKIRGWGSVDSDVAYVVRSIDNPNDEAAIPDHEFERIGFDPASLRRYENFEMVHKGEPVYHEDGIPE